MRVRFFALGGGGGGGGESGGGGGGWVGGGLMTVSLLTRVMNDTGSYWW